MGNLDIRREVALFEILTRDASASRRASGEALGGQPNRKR